MCVKYEAFKSPQTGAHKHEKQHKSRRMQLNASPAISTSDTDSLSSLAFFLWKEPIGANISK